MESYGSGNLLQQANLKLLGSARENSIVWFLKCYSLEKLKPSLNTQADPIRTKLFLQLV